MIQNEVVEKLNSSIPGTTEYDALRELLIMMVGGMHPDAIDATESDAQLLSHDGRIWIKEDTNNEACWIPSWGDERPADGLALVATAGPVTKFSGNVRISYGVEVLA